MSHPMEPTVPKRFLPVAGSGRDSRPGLSSVSAATLDAWVAGQGAPAYRARQIADWTWGRGAEDVAEMRTLPAALRSALGGIETAPDLEAQLADEAAGLVEALLPAWIERRIHARPQAAEGATVTRPLRRSDGLLDPGRPAALLERQVRAYQPWPGSWLETPGGRLIVWAARPLSLAGLPADAVVPAALVPDDGGLALTTVDGALRLDEVQLAGGRRMSSAELRRGHPELSGCRIEGFGVR